jgi:hypothetical protein
MRERERERARERARQRKKERGRKRPNQQTIETRVAKLIETHRKPNYSSLFYIYLKMQQALVNDMLSWS